jgi:hypothetical protein
LAARDAWYARSASMQIILLAAAVVSAVIAQ